MSSRLNRKAIKSYTMIPEVQTAAAYVGFVGYLRTLEVGGILDGLGNLKYGFSSRPDNNAGSLELETTDTDELRISHNVDGVSGYQWGIQDRPISGATYVPATQVTVAVDAQPLVVALWDEGTQRYILAASGLLAYLTGAVGTEVDVVLTFAVTPPP